METPESPGQPTSNFKISCKNCPSEFFLDKNVAKEYFRLFGRIKKITLKLKPRKCIVEYMRKEGFLKALHNAGEYNGKHFKVSVESSPDAKKKVAKVPKPLWAEQDEVKAELEAMGGFTPKSYVVSEVIDLTDSLTEAPKLDKSPKLKRTRPSDAVPMQKKKTRTSEKLLTSVLPEQLDLVNLVKTKAATVEDKYRVLDARDKLLRIKLKRSAQVKSSPTVGTCPDMCPEKERLMRETQHQVALYEQEDNDRSMNPAKAVKQYSRSSADQEAPLPHELRPVSVLQMTMGYLMHNIMDLCDSSEVNLAEWFHFLWDRTRGIRKDITQQELCGQGAVELVEQCARFHIHCSARLVAEDPSVFDQRINTENLTKCLQSLKYMYYDLQLKGESCPNEAEFRAYIILLNLNDGNFMWEVQELRQAIQKSKEVRFALEVYSALDKCNYVKFFKLVYSTTYLNACVLMRYFVQVRVTAIKTLLKCYKPRAFRTIYPLRELAHLLAFDDVESTTEFMQTYGLSINEEKSHIILEKNSFLLPEFPYILDRSLNVVELKRTDSVGKIVCGAALPPKTYENHVPQNSFDAKDFLVIKDLFDEADLEAPTLKPPAEFEDSDSADRELIAATSVTSDSSTKQSILREQPKVLGAFVAVKREPPPNETVQKPVTKSVTPSIFSSAAQDQVDAIAVPKATQVEVNRKAPSQSFFTSATQTPASLFTKTASIFGASVASASPKEAPKAFPPASGPNKGGFTFKLPAPVKKAPRFVKPAPPTLPMASIRMPITPDEAAPQFNFEDLEALRKKEEQEKLRRELEQERRRTMERKLLEEKRREEEKLREIKKRKQEEELRKRMEAMRREEERLKQEEIRNVVTAVLDEVVGAVDAKLRDETLALIQNKIQRRLLLKATYKWRQVVLKNKRKRKALDCSPVWVNTKTPKQSAEELHTPSQNLTLAFMKRYKYGKSLDIPPLEEHNVRKINLFQLTCTTLNQRYFDLRGTIQKSIFWKVEISLPDHYELNSGLNRIEETLRDAFQWTDRNGTIMSLEQARPNPAQSVTYCIERQSGLYVRYADANGIIFVAKDFNTLLQRRIFENLKNYGVFTKIPIVIILQNYDEGECKLKALIDEKIVSDYIILVENLTPRALVNLVEEALVFLASKVEKPPPLELDTLHSFVTKYLCTETWKRANSFAKWNSHYKTCLRSPNVVISLYNEGLLKLRKIVLNKSCYEYATFPEVFTDFLENQIPDFLPCNYHYFPKFWKNESYTAKVEKIFKNLTLPKWQDKWPPSNELELEVNVSKYCTKVFKEPEKPFYNLMSVFLRNVDPNENFEDVGKVLWTDVIEVLGSEKLRESNLGLTGTSFENKSIFNQYVIVYDVNTLDGYTKTDWFYISNALIKKQLKQQLNAERRVESKPENATVDLSLNVDLDKMISDVSKQIRNKENISQMKKELVEFSTLMEDLETSIKIHRKISSTLEENLRTAIENN